MAIDQDDVCSGCGKPAKLQCPKCLQLELPAKISSFCSQECFQGVWSTHKHYHKVGPHSYMYVTDRGRGRSNYMPDYNWTGDLRPARCGPSREVPQNVKRRPDWHVTGLAQEEKRNQVQVPVTSEEDLESLKAACRLGREVLDAAHRAVGVGVTTDEIDRVVHDMTVDAGAYPSPLNYFWFPKSVCTSVNEVICHGIPDMRELQEGDIVNVDVSLYLNGMHSDLNETFAVGTVEEQSEKLLKTSYECLMKSVEACKPGVRYRDLGDIIQKHAQKNGMSVVKTYCGHGVGRQFHCQPTVPHYAGNKAPGRMQVGHVFTIEPMINCGTYRDVTWPDQWTAVSADGSRSSQYEHTLIITEGGCDILTQRLESSPPLYWMTQDGV